MPKFSAKILLFGEHTVLRGSNALAVPFQDRYAYWVWEQNSNNENLIAFANYLSEHLATAFDIEEFKEEIRQGLNLQSNIPSGYGLGSSGALCVAVYQRFATAKGKALCQADPKAFLGQMESYFHGASSGTDPLIIYLQQSILLSSQHPYQAVELKAMPTAYQFFLLDTSQARNTAPLVEQFVQTYDQNERFRSQVDQEWIPATNKAITAMLEAKADDLWQAFYQISDFQYNHLQNWLIDRLNPLWLQGLKTQNYLLKICGAGGGGYCLGLTKDWAATQETLSNFELIKLDLNKV